MNEGAPPRQPIVAYRGGRPLVDAPTKDREPPQQHRMMARNYRKLFITPPAKRRRVELPHSPTPSTLPPQFSKNPLLSPRTLPPTSQQPPPLPFVVGR